MPAGLRRMNSTARSFRGINEETANDRYQNINGNNTLVFFPSTDGSVVCAFFLIRAF